MRSSIAQAGTYKKPLHVEYAPLYERSSGPLLFYVIFLHLLPIRYHDLLYTILLA